MSKAKTIVGAGGRILLLLSLAALAAAAYLSLRPFPLIRPGASLARPGATKPDRLDVVRLKRVARVAIPQARSIALDDSSAWIGQNLLGLTLLDIRTPSHPVVIRTFAPEDVQALHLAVVRPHLLAIADRFRGLRLWDVTTPGVPIELSTLLLPGIPNHLVAFRQRDVLYVAAACGNEGVVVVDISNPRSPAIVGHLTQDTDFSRRLAIVQGLGCLADHHDGGLKLVDLRRPDHPSLLLKVLYSGFCEAVTVRDDLLVAGYRNHGIRLFRLHPPPSADSETTPTAEFLCALHRSQHRVRDLTIFEDSLLAVADDEAGIHLYDLARPQLPVLCAEWRYPEGEKGSASSVLWDRGYLYLPSWDGGLNILLVERPPTRANR